MRKVALTYVLCVAVHLIFAQKDSVRLDEITITDYRSKISSANFSETKIDSATRSNFLASSVAQLFLQQNNAFVKTYGPANIASLTLRGSTAQQVAVVWNGVNINNPMLGQTDVSLLPVGFFDEASLQKGPLSAYWGSGAMAGVLNLRSSVPTEGLNVKVGSSYSTLQNFTQFVSVGFAKGRWSTSTRLLGDLSNNRYSYYANFDSLRVATQQHARATQRALMQDVGFKINNAQSLSLHLWVQEANRQVPYTLLELKQDASQQDKTFRGLLDWTLKQNKHSVAARGAFFNEALNYENKTYALSSHSLFQTIMADVEAQFFLSKGITLTAGNSNSLSIGRTESYNGWQQISRNAVFENLTWKNFKANVSLYGRQEIFNGRVFVPTGGISGGVQILKHVACKINAGSIFRYPTLNDLYWSPGGNPNLKPEKGFSEEGSLVFNYPVRKFALTFTGTLFNRNINNWIMWLPGANGIWTPQNVPTVWSRGGETNSEFKYTGAKIQASLNVITNYVISTRTQNTSENDNSRDKQLPYVPMYSGSGIFSLVVGSFSLRTVYSYMGYRYLTSDNYNYLLPYHLLDVRIGYTIAVKKVAMNIFAEGNNLLNENYYSVAQYPMPLRNFKVGCIFQFSKTNKKSI